MERQLEVLDLIENREKKEYRENSKEYRVFFEPGSRIFATLLL